MGVGVYLLGGRRLSGGLGKGEGRDGEREG